METSRVAFALLSFSLVFCTSRFARAEEPKGSLQMQGQHITVKPDAIKWKDGPASLPKGAKMSALKGDMTKAELFAVRFEFPAGYRIPNHFHPADENITVLTGALYLGTPDAKDDTAAEKLPAGTFSSMPAGMKHFAFAKEKTIIQLNGQGPWGITYVNEKDDPRNGTQTGKVE